MRYSLEFGPKAEKFIDKLQKDIAIRIIEKLKQIQEDPFRYLEHYEGDDCYKMRIGDFRALVDVDFSSKKLIVRIIDKRGRIYDRN